LRRSATAATAAALDDPELVLIGAKDQLLIDGPSCLVTKDDGRGAAAVHLHAHDGYAATG
jgi:hypothetical protein